MEPALFDFTAEPVVTVGAIAAEFGLF